MQPLYTTLKVNNEIELCEVSDPDCKQLIERALLKNRISYYGFMEADSSEETHLKNIPLKERTLQDMEILFLFQSTTD